MHVKWDSQFLYEAVNKISFMFSSFDFLKYRFFLSPVKQVLILGFI